MHRDQLGLDSETSPPAYVPVPAKMARYIGAQYAKDVVVVAVFDRKHNRTQHIVHGATPYDRAIAGALGDKIAELLGLDAGGVKIHEDFRVMTAAGWKAKERDMLATIRRQRTRIRLLVVAVVCASLINLIALAGRFL